MITLQLTPSVIALILLAVHFLRAENFVAIVLCVLTIVLVFVRRPWAARAIQAALLIGALEWLRSTVLLVQARSSLGEPFLRLAAIMGGVTLFTFSSALALQARRAKVYFGFAANKASSDV